MYRSRGKNGKRWDAAGTRGGTAQPQLTRTEGRELKMEHTVQKQAQKQGIDENENADFFNIKKKFGTSDLGPGVLTRKERWVRCSDCIIGLSACAFRSR